MEVFISWSGSTSLKVAEALREWLPNVIQSLDPWISSEDLQKGTRWFEEISTRLENTSTGIVCLTPDNLQSPWLHFEAGALSKIKGKSSVSGYLLMVRHGDISGPLTSFNNTEATKPDTERLVGTLNAHLPKPIAGPVLSRSFEKHWPDLESEISKIKRSYQSGAASRAPAIIRTDREILEELVQAVRGMASSVQDSVTEQAEQIEAIWDAVAGGNTGWTKHQTGWKIGSWKAARSRTLTDLTNTLQQAIKEGLPSTPPANVEKLASDIVAKAEEGSAKADARE